MSQAASDQIHRRLDEIEDAVNSIKTPLSFADQLYVLREHVNMVRRRLEGGHRTGTASQSTPLPGAAV